MKLGLLTFHTAANFGAALQAYALQEFLEDEGFNAEYIDYQNHHRRMIYDMPFRVKVCVKKRKLLEASYYAMGMPFMNMRKRKFEDFNHKYLHISDTFYCDKKDMEKSNGLYDMFIVGSDQVWNPGNNGKDTAFMLSFVHDDEKKISYASSFGLSEVPDSIKNDYAESMKRITHLSTRELSGVRIIKELTGRDAKLVLDPVFLLPRIQWMELIADCPMTGNYLFSYTNRKDQMSEFLRTGYDMKGMKHHKLSRFTTISDFFNPKVKIKYDMSPQEFLANINGAKMVVSASFHCICFAIILNKPFICFLTGNEGKDERLKTLLTHFGLTERVYKEGMPLSDVMKPIDWERVNRIVEEKRNDSSAFLRGALKQGTKGGFS